jgi:hypothetical protein
MTAARDPEAAAKIALVDDRESHDLLARGVTPLRSSRHAASQPGPALRRASAG